MQNKCIRFCLQLDKLSPNSLKDLKILTGWKLVLGFNNMLLQSCLNLSMATVRTT